MPSVLIKYPPGNNGKFIVNCLGLGDNAVLQHEELAKLQLTNSLNKLSEILRRLSNETEDWKDLDLGDYQLFGVAAGDPRGPISAVVQQVHDRNWYTFMISHKVLK